MVQNDYDGTYFCIMMYDAKNYLKLSRAGHMFCIMEDEAKYIDREVRLADVASISAGYPFRGSIEELCGILGDTA